MTARQEKLIVETLRAAVGERPIVLGGSRAAGTARFDSDYDVFVVMPLRRLPHALPALTGAGSAISAALGVPASVNPLPPFRWRRPDRNLLVWKLWREGRVLAGAEELRLAQPGPPPLTAYTRSSYAVSALRYLLTAVNADELARGCFADPSLQGVRKAQLHLAQLELWSRGLHASTLDEALALAAPGAVWADLARSPASADCWLRTCDELVARLNLPRESRLRVIAVGIQFVLLSSRAGRRAPLHKVLRSPSVRQRFWRATRLLACAVTREGVDKALVKRAATLLPGRCPASEWAALRDYLELEWPNADPIVGL